MKVALKITGCYTPIIQQNPAFTLFQIATCGNAQFHAHVTKLKSKKSLNFVTLVLTSVLSNDAESRLI